MLNAKSRNGLTQPVPANYATEVPMLKMLFPCNEGIGGITDLVSGVKLSASGGDEEWSQDANGIWGIRHEELDTVTGDIPFFHDTSKDMIFFIILQDNYASFEFSLGDTADANYLILSQLDTASELQEDSGTVAAGPENDISGDLDSTYGGSIFMFRDSRVGGESIKIHTGTCNAVTGAVSQALGATGLLLGTSSAMAGEVQKGYVSNQPGVRMSGIGAFQVSQSAAGANTTNLDDVESGISWMTQQWRLSNTKKIYPNWINRPVSIPAVA